jgi:fumarate hydratase class II
LFSFSIAPKPDFPKQQKGFSKMSERVHSVRVESDTMGQIEVENSRYWGAQTQRSLMNFKIGSSAERMPIEVIRAMAILKRASAQVNIEFGLDKKLAQTIITVADEVHHSREVR